jgi:CheY-like chemotaxis protein
VTFDILVADDSEGFVALLREAARHAGLQDRLHAVANGKEAIAYLDGKGRFANRLEHPFPAYLLIDLYMPVLDGFEFVEAVRANKQFKLLPIHIWTGSVRKEDIDRAYKLGATSFQMKPGTPKGLQDALLALHSLHEALTSPPMDPGT